MGHAAAHAPAALQIWSGPHVLDEEHAEVHAHTQDLATHLASPAHVSWANRWSPQSSTWLQYVGTSD